MKIDLSAKILDLKGKPLPDADEELTLGSVICAATINQTPDEKDMKASDKVRLFQLAERAVVGGEQDFTLEDAAFVKERIGRMFGPLVVGRAYKLLEGETDAKAS
jgi:hypothetical protein